MKLDVAKRSNLSGPEIVVAANLRVGLENRFQFRHLVGGQAAVHEGMDGFAQVASRLDHGDGREHDGGDGIERGGRWNPEEILRVRDLLNTTAKAIVDGPVTPRPTQENAQ